MAPYGETLIVTPPPPQRCTKSHQKPQKISIEGLQRAMSDLSFELSKESMDTTTLALAPISEVEDAKCECCGMLEECTHEYIGRVRDKFFGKWICGLCTEAVKEELEKNGGKHQEALGAHMSMCTKFHRLRTHPVLFQAEAMREMLRKSTRTRSKSTSPRDHNKDGVVKRGCITRSSSCMSAITSKEINQKKRMQC